MKLISFLPSAVGLAFLEVQSFTVNAFVPQVKFGVKQYQQKCSVPLSTGLDAQQRQQTRNYQSSASASALYSSVAVPSPPPLAPLTLWGEQISDIKSLQAQARSETLPSFALEISASKDLQLSSVDAELEYFQKNADDIKQKMQDHGCVVFRDFELMKTQQGFEQFYKAVGMRPCLDPLHSVSARPTIDGSKNSPVYEAVNKESRKNFFIGMHNEFVGTRAPRAAAFGCFKAAEVGGEFIVADGRRIFRDVDSDILEELYTRQIRYSVMELPFFDWVYKLPSVVQSPVEQVIQTIVSAAINAKVDFKVDMSWQSEGNYNNDGDASASEFSKFLQARAPRQPPVVVHPITNDPTWFCNVHSHSSKLRRDREQLYGAERFEDGASRINKSDMYFGDDSPLTEKQLQHLDEVTTANMKYIKMREGDVVLLDNYKTMHGRNVFDGTRKHGVCWFEGWEGEEKMKASNKKATTTTTNKKAATDIPYFVNA